jgi:hypothetical protein
MKQAREGQGATNDVDEITEEPYPYDAATFETSQLRPNGSDDGSSEDCDIRVLPPGEIRPMSYFVSMLAMHFSILALAPALTLTAIE